MIAPRHPAYFALLVICCLGIVVSAILDPERRFVYIFLLLLGIVGLWYEVTPSADEENGDELGL